MAGQGSGAGSCTDTPRSETTHKLAHTCGEQQGHGTDLKNTAEVNQQFREGSQGVVLGWRFSCVFGGLMFVYLFESDTSYTESKDLILLNDVKRSKSVDFLVAASIYSDQEVYKSIFIKTVVAYAIGFLLFPVILL